MKLILNIQFSANIKFKISFDTENNTKTFGDLLQVCVTRLQTYGFVVPEHVKVELPASYQLANFSLQDSSNFKYFESDLVEDLCSNNDVVHLISLENLNQSVVSTAQSQAQISGQQIQVQSQQLAPIQQVVSQANIQPIQALPPPVDQQPQIQVTQTVPAVQISDGALQDQIKFDFYLDTTNYLKIQQMGGDLQIRLRFPQSIDLNQEFEYNIGLDCSLLDFSKIVCESLKLDSEKYHLALYGLRGQALYASMNVLHQKTVSEVIGKYRTFNGLITKCSAGSKVYPKIDHDDGPDQIFVLHEGAKVVRLNLLKDTVLNLKQKVYSKLNFPTNVQNLFYSGKTLNDQQLLKEYNIQANSNVQLTFKHSEFVSYADSYNFNFYTPWLEHRVTQSIEGVRQFRSTTLVLLRTMTDKKFLSAIRCISNDAPLILALNSLMQNRRLNQLQRIVFEEGCLCLFFKMMTLSTIPANFDLSKIFEYSRKMLSVILNQMKTVNLYGEYRLVELNCMITMKKIKNIALFQPTKAAEKSQWLIVDYDLILEKQQKEELHNDVPFHELALEQPEWLLEEFTYIKNSEMEAYVFIEPEQAQQVFQIEVKDDWHLNNDSMPAGQCKILSPAELKQHPAAPSLTKNAQKQLVIYTSMNKDVKKPINLFDVMTGMEYSENPDTLASVQSAINNLGAAVSDEEDDSTDNQLIRQISTAPDEAVIVLFDISGSMDEDFYQNSGLTRLGVVKAFFSAFADRTMAYSLKNVISLVFFDDRHLIKCGFTEAFVQFKELVNKAKTGGRTALYDSIGKAIQSLLQLRQSYPNTLLRIIALTDGEDNGSRTKPIELIRNIIQERICLDSFVVYDKCEALKKLTHAVGGKCFSPRTIQEGLRLFEYETILTAKNRSQGQNIDLNTALMTFLAKQVNGFDVDPHKIQLPIQIARDSINPQHLVQQISQNSQQLQVYAPNAVLKRVVKEIIDYEVKPHPFIKIYPCKEDISFWKIILIGPENTPYAQGVFTLYMKFSDQYPIKPPELRFLTSIYHCNINQQGRICHSILDRNYTPDLRVLQIFEQIYGLLMTPEPDDPLDTTIASEYMQDLPLYLNKAREHTQANAKKPMDEVLKQILGESQQMVMSDNELQKKIEEINSWITQSQQPQ